jgi:hypothetical protein
MQRRRGAAIRVRSKEQWFELALLHRGPHQDEPVLSYPNGFALDIKPADKLSKQYTLHNWESGILSGIFFACRNLELPIQDWLVTRFKGRLGSQAMDVLAVAAGGAVLRSLADPASPLKLPAGWREITRKRSRAQRKVG